eukprot:10552747-Karenia_brevis.AAC.1
MDLPELQMGDKAVEKPIAQMQVTRVEVPQAQYKEVIEERADEVPQEDTTPSLASSSELFKEMPLPEQQIVNTVAIMGDAH